MKKISSILIVLIIIISSCSKGGGGGASTVDCNTVTHKAFAADVNPIIQSSCTQAGCHGNGSTNGPGPLLTYNQIFNAKDNIRAAVSSGLMPQNSTLSTSQKNSITCWIDGGAPPN